MKREVISQAISDISDRHIEEAADFKAEKKARPWIKWTALAACVCIVVAVSVPVIKEFSHPPKKGVYRYEYEELEFISAPLDDMQTERGSIIFNQITDIEAYIRFNTPPDRDGITYYDLRNTTYDLVCGDFGGFNIGKTDGSIENNANYGNFIQLEKDYPNVAKIITRMLELYPAVTFSYDENAAAIQLSPLGNCIISVAAAEDLSSVDQRFDEILPILKSGESSLIADQEVSIHYFYYNNGKSESYIYYAYFEKDGMEYQYQLTSSKSPIFGGDILEFTDPQGNCRQAFADYLLAILS